MVGLWDVLPTPGDKTIPGFAIITTDANELMTPINDRNFPKYSGDISDRMLAGDDHLRKILSQDIYPWDAHDRLPLERISPTDKRPDPGSVSNSKCFQGRKHCTGEIPIREI